LIPTKEESYGEEDGLIEQIQKDIGELLRERDVTWRQLEEAGMVVPQRPDNHNESPLVE